MWQAKNKKTKKQRPEWLWRIFYFVSCSWRGPRGIKPHIGITVKTPHNPFKLLLNIINIISRD
jgi:hypothetical protein